MAGQRVGGVLVGVRSWVCPSWPPRGPRGSHRHPTTAALSDEVPNINQLGEVLFTDYVFAFEITAVLLTIAVVGAVVLVRRPRGEMVDLEEFPGGTAADQLERDAGGPGPAEDDPGQPGGAEQLGEGEPAGDGEPVGDGGEVAR
ncbi:MAG: NADH-quinone oxidoreductase subunit J [Microthrixaceae bacterium]